MVLDIQSITEVAVGAVTVTGGVYSALKRFRKATKEKKDSYRADILKEAKREAERIKGDLENKIKALEDEFQTQKQNFIHFKEIYSAEIKVLGEKIELLRADISKQHTDLVGLLTRLVDR